jgi:hypothetical protein
MNFKVIKAYLDKQSSVTLWHGTIKDHLQSIKKNWLMPGTGAFTEEHEADAEEMGVPYESAVFFADKRRLDMSIGAMVQAIRKKLDKYDVTEEDIEEHGLLVKLKGEGGKAVPQFQYRPTRTEIETDHREWARAEEYTTYPYSVEPGDHFSTEAERPTDFFTGKKLIRLLKKYNAWPATHLAPSPKRRKTLLDLLKKMDRNNPIVEVLRAQVYNMSDREVEAKIQEVRKALGSGRPLNLEYEEYQPPLW